MTRVPMNMVPLSPITMLRAPGWPLDQTSALKPAGSLILSSGSLSTGVTVGGVGCGESLVSCWLLDGFDLSIGLKPGCADADDTASAVPSASAGHRNDCNFMWSSPNRNASSAATAAGFLADS